MAISAPGIGSGLDIKGIVSQLVELEKKPLAQLASQATGFQAKLSAFGQLKSQLANLQDQAQKLATTSSWEAVTISSSNSAAVSGRVTSNAASANRLSVEVSQLAKAQATASGVFDNDKTFGAGALTITLGSWSGSSFAAGSKNPVNVSVAAGDSLDTVASKINGAGAGVSATVLRDDSGARLILTSKDTGTEAGFRVQVGGSSDLEALRYDPANAGTGMTLNQAALNTLGTVNNLPVSSSNNQLKNVIPGVDLTISQVTSSPVEVRVTQDTASIKTNITNLVQSFNAISGALREMTKYEAGTKTAGTLQGDATAVGLQSMLRRMFTAQGPSSSTFKNLSEMGVTFQLDGTLKVDDTKLTAALNNPGELQDFFSDAGGGLAKRLQTFAEGALNAGGTIGGRYKALENAISRNSKDQERLNQRIERTEARLLAQYGRLDTQLGKLSSLNDYVSQQITSWNRSRE